jgi:hypothetical protein
MNSSKKRKEKKTLQPNEFLKKEKEKKPAHRLLVLRVLVRISVGLWSQNK